MGDIDAEFAAALVRVAATGPVTVGTMARRFTLRSRPWISQRLHEAVCVRPLPGVSVTRRFDVPWTYQVTPAEPSDAFAFAAALRDPHVRAALAVRGYVDGWPTIVGRDTDPDGYDPGPVFRVWRDPDVPGGWNGEVIYR
jgi:hypothetical protein